jgi:hypothetical protein
MLRVATNEFLSGASAHLAVRIIDFKEYALTAAEDHRRHIAFKGQTESLFALRHGRGHRGFDLHRMLFVLGLGAVGFVLRVGSSYGNHSRESLVAAESGAFEFDEQLTAITTLQFKAGLGPRGW